MPEVHTFDRIPVVPKNDVTFINCTVSMSSSTPRKYSLHVQPTEEKQGDGDISFYCYNPRLGYRWTLLTVARKSRRAEAQAIALAEERLAEMVEHCLKEQGLTRLPPPVVKSEAEALMNNYNQYQKGLPGWARGPA